MTRRRWQPATVPTVRACCPDCHVLHDVPRSVVGHYLWNVCCACARKIEAETRRVLHERGIGLPWLEDHT